MALNVSQIVSDVLVLGFGALGSWAVWVTVHLFKSKRDLDAAFHKIRTLEGERNGFTGEASCRTCGEADH